MTAYQFLACSLWNLGFLVFLVFERFAQIPHYDLVTDMRGKASGHHGYRKRVFHKPSLVELTV